MPCEYLAHIAGDRTQTVTEHLAGTAELCARFARAFGAAEQGKPLGFAHDIGKCSREFQTRLRGGRIVDHAAAGAWECAKPDAVWASACIAGHHGGLPDFGNPALDTADTPTVCGRLRKAAAGHIPAYQMPLSLPRADAPGGYGNNSLLDSFIIRMLYSCLVDADYLDTERFMSGGTTAPRAAVPLPPLLPDRLEQHISQWRNPDGALNRRRCEILRACMEGGAGGLSTAAGGGQLSSLDAHVPRPPARGAG